MPHEIVPVFLAGGRGARLRPLTSAARPKPFLRLFDKKSLLQQSLQRVRHLGAPVIVCHRDFAGKALREAEDMGIEPLAVIAEPEGRGTAAAIAAAARLIAKESPDALMLAMPCDHYIADTEILRRVLNEAGLQAAERIVMIGAKPSRVSTRYGYIRHEAGEVVSFQEKPKRETARNYLKSGGMLWNTGMFLCRAGFFLELLGKYEPTLEATIGEAMTKSRREGKIVYPEAGSYGRSPCMAVDIAVMERCKAALVLPLETPWSDIGCWSALIGVWLGRFFKKSRIIDALRIDRGSDLWITGF